MPIQLIMPCHDMLMPCHTVCICIIIHQAPFVHCFIIHIVCSLQSYLHILFLEFYKVLDSSSRVFRSCLCALFYYTYNLFFTKLLLTSTLLEFYNVVVVVVEHLGLVLSIYLSIYPIYIYNLMFS